MMRRLLLLVGLVALVIALAMTGVLSLLRVSEVVEVFPLPPETLDLPLPAGSGSDSAMAPSLTPASGAAGRPAIAILQAGRDDYTGCSDTYIQYYLPTDNFCSSPELYMVTSNKAATLLRFDLTKLPSNVVGLNSDAVIVQATLELYAVQGNKGVVMGIYLPRGPWDPCTVTWDTPWEQPGADGASDREQEPRVEGTTQQETGWIAFDVTGLVQEWLREPAQNYGIIIKSFDISQPSHHIFFSCDHPGEDVRPQLTIKYEPAPPAPLPTEAASSPTRETAATPTSAPIPTGTMSPSMPTDTTTAAPTQTAMPAATSVPTPTLVLPLSPRVIELHWQSQMNVGESYPIQVVFRPATGALGGNSTVYQLSVYAQVTAPAFDVVQNSPTEQVLEQPEDSLSWSWQAEPRMVGSQTLSLDLLFRWKPATSVAANVTKDSGTWYQTKVIKVVRPFRYWMPLEALRGLLLAIALICLVGWFILSARTRAHSLGD